MNEAFVGPRSFRHTFSITVLGATLAQFGYVITIFLGRTMIIGTKPTRSKLLPDDRSDCKITSSINLLIFIDFHESVIGGLTNEGTDPHIEI